MLMLHWIKALEQIYSFALSNTRQEHTFHRVFTNKTLH